MKESLEELIERIKKRIDCRVFPSSNQPSVAVAHQIPVDLQEFYRLCDGIDLFMDSPFPMSMVRSEEFRVANNIMFEGMNLEDLKDDITWSWYIVVDYKNGNYITIDLSEARNGLCYDSNWVLHGGNSYVVAKSFTELLEQLILAEGEIEFWEEIPQEQRRNPYDLL